ncbi:hypothetical protein ATO12_14810 [Aquimarina atlantica]|uniref:Uncharacterized protein n=1 Tax=Aquimarina atlantica TaxID=1317122 RepID=A0A023BVT3_9FLAO|nr:hypothetical protein [Aquimarina atlantica]EZH74142.1 hypothetical protein ATO12_14810 [Aquimarina atlantica]
MNKKILFLFLLPILSFSQIQQEFYVDDVEIVEHLTVNFCVDNDGKTSSVTIIPNRTTYKNQENIDKVVAYRKSIEYYPDSKLRNNCYDYTFIFVNNKYNKKELNTTECTKCNVFKRGKYKYGNINYPDVIIKRRKNIQIEKDKDSKSKYRIEWISPCEYNLTYTMVSEKKHKYLLGETINVKIIDILDNGNYVYHSNLLDRTITTGVIKKVN